MNVIEEPTQEEISKYADTYTTKAATLKANVKIQAKGCDELEILKSSSSFLEAKDWYWGGSGSREGYLFSDFIDIKNYN